MSKNKVITLFSSKSYDREFFQQANEKYGFDIIYQEARLSEKSLSLAQGSDIICVFVNDIVNQAVLQALARNNTKIIALRCAGFNNVDIEAVMELDFQIVRVPAYSPYAVAEHAVALSLTLARRIHRAYNRVREANFALDGLIGFDLRGKTVGVIGTGQIGQVFAKIMAGFGCRVLACDPVINKKCGALGVCYVELNTLLAESSVISLHVPLVPNTHHLINQATIDTMKVGVMLINTSRGALLDTRAVIQGLKTGKIGYLGIDVYEEESDLFFEDLSNIVVQDDIFARLLTFPNVVVTGHQGFFTREALHNIAMTTMANIADIIAGKECSNMVTQKLIAE